MGVAGIALGGGLAGWFSLSLGGAAPRAALVQTDWLEPAGRRCGC